MTCLLTVYKDLHLAQGQYPSFLKANMHVSAEHGLRAVVQPWFLGDLKSLPTQSVRDSIRVLVITCCKPQMEKIIWVTYTTFFNSLIFGVPSSAFFSSNVEECVT